MQTHLLKVFLKIITKVTWDMMVKTICTQVHSHLLQVTLNNDILHYLYSSAYSHLLKVILKIINYQSHLGYDG